jgi:DNA-binding FadR family transcriptional regulator
MIDGTPDRVINREAARLPPTSWSPVPGLRDAKLAERVAAAIEADVIRAGWPVGTLIGSEEQLLARFGVGRGVLHEVARLVEHRQIAKIRRGRNGGLFVAEPSFAVVNTSLAIYLEYANVELSDLFEARSVLELFAASYAARTVGDSHVVALQGAIDSEVRQGAKVACRAAYHFHELVADSTDNPALTLFVQALASLTDRPLRIASAVEKRPEGVGEQIHRDHVAIAAAIASGDGLLARDYMREHLKILQQAIADISNASSDVDKYDSGVNSRRAEVIAQRIRRDIVALGWPVGRRLGFEPELLERYGLSRAQFREAVRILESHSVVEMRRGTDGGMVVTAPDGRELMRACSLYLRRRGMDRTQLQDVREELEVATVTLTIERLTADGIEQLNEVVRREQECPDDEFYAVGHDLHALIAELSGSRALALLVSILSQLSAERMLPGDITPRESPDAIRYVHRAIVEAIIHRDDAQSVRLMRKHLRGVTDEGQQVTPLTSMAMLSR